MPVVAMSISLSINIFGWLGSRSRSCVLVGRQRGPCGLLTRSSIGRPFLEDAKHEQCSIEMYDGPFRTETHEYIRIHACVQSR